MKRTDMERRYPVVWAMNNIVLPKGKWDFEGRAWQIDIFNDMAKAMVVRKPAQVGMTTIVLAKVLHWAVFHQGNIMYTLPRQTDVTDLVNARFREIVVNSPRIANLVGEVDNVRMKKIGRSIIQFAEASVEPRMMDVDFLVNDEFDLSNQENMELLGARLYASKYQIHYRFSTPTISNFGISALFDISDQKHWVVRCPRCRADIILDWDVHVRTDDTDAWYACDRCDKELTGDVISSGQWVAKYPNREISGYQVSQMICPYIPPSRVLQQRSTMGDKAFYNLCLGLPYDGGRAGLGRSTILNSCFLSGHTSEDHGNGYFLGADQGGKIHVAVGRYDGDIIRIVHLDVLEGDDAFDRLVAIAERYGIRYGIVDALPNRYSAIRACEDTRGRMVTGMVRDSRAVSGLYSTRSERLVYLNKSECFDMLHDYLRSGRIQFYGTAASMDDMVSAAVDSLAGMRRDVETTTSKVGPSQRVIWRHISGDDHFADAIMFMMMAVHIGGRSVRSSIVDIMERVRARKEDSEDELLSQNPHVRSGSNSALQVWKRVMARRKLK